MSCIPGSKAQDSGLRKQIFQNSGFLKQKFPSFRNPDSLACGNTYVKGAGRDGVEKVASNSENMPRGLYFQRPFLRGLFLEGLIFGGGGLSMEKNLHFKIDWASLTQGRKFTAYKLRYKFGGLTFGGAYCRNSCTVMVNRGISVSEVHFWEKGFY